MGIFDDFLYSRAISRLEKTYSEYVHSNAPREQIMSYLSAELKKKPNDPVVLYYMMSEVIQSHDMAESIAFFTQVENMDLSEELRKSRLLKYCLDDILLSSPHLYKRMPGTRIEDHRATPIQGDEPEYVATSREYVQYFVKMKLYALLRENMCYQDSGEPLFVPVDHVSFICGLADHYLDGLDGLDFLYLQGFIALEWRFPDYGLQLINEYISLTKDNSDKFNHDKFFSRGLAFIQMRKYKAAIFGLTKSLEFTDDPALIDDVNQRIRFCRAGGIVENM